MAERLNLPVSGERYRHFKGGLYKIITIAKHSETEELLVIYQALYGDMVVYARPLEMFVGQNDKGQKRFVKEEDVASGENDTSEEKTNIVSDETQILFEILDAESVKDKLSIIKENRYRLNSKTLGNLAVSMDVVLVGDDIEEHYQQIVQYLETRARFETNRLR